MLPISLKTRKSRLDPVPISIGKLAVRVYDHVPGTHQAPPWASFPVEEAGPGDRQSPVWGAGLDLESGGHKRQHGVTGQRHTVKKTVTEVSHSQCYGEARFCFIFLVKEENMNLQEDRVCSLCPDAGWPLPDGQRADQGGGGGALEGHGHCYPHLRRQGEAPSDEQLAGRQTGNPPARPRPGNGSSHLHREKPRPHIPAKSKT